MVVFVAHFAQKNRASGRKIDANFAKKSSQSWRKNRANFAKKVGEFSSTFSKKLRNLPRIRANPADSRRTTAASPGSNGGAAGTTLGSFWSDPGSIPGPSILNGVLRGNQGFPLETPLKMLEPDSCLGAVPESCLGAVPDSFLGAVPDKLSGSRPGQAVWELSRTSCLGALPDKLSGSCPRQLSGSCPRQLSGSCPRQLSGSCPRELPGSCPRQLSGSVSRAPPFRGARETFLRK